jgi:hypothetical protein
MLSNLRDRLERIVGPDSVMLKTKFAGMKRAYCGENPVKAD